MHPYGRYDSHGRKYNYCKKCGACAFIDGQCWECNAMSDWKKAQTGGQPSQRYWKRKEIHEEWEYNIRQLEDKSEKMAIQIAKMSESMASVNQGYQATLKNAQLHDQ